MAGGRPRKPTELKLLQGTGQKNPQRLNPDEPKLGLAVLKPPSWLTPESKRAWKRAVPILVHQMRVLTEADHEAMIGLATSAGQIEWCEKDIRENGRLVPVYAMMPGTNQPVLINDHPIIVKRERNPSSQMMKDAWSAMRSYMAALGMSPSDRSRVSAMADESKVDPMLSLLGGHEA